MALRKYGTIAAFAILTLVNIGGFVQQRWNTDDVAELQRVQDAEARRVDIKNCEAGNESRLALVNLFKELRPASEIRRPGETDAQYTFRLDQTATGYALLEKRLAPKDCEKVVNG